MRFLSPTGIRSYSLMHKNQKGYIYHLICVIYIILLLAYFLELASIELSSKTRILVRTFTQHSIRWETSIHYGECQTQVLY